MPTEPFFFAKLPSSVVGPETSVKKLISFLSSFMPLEPGDIVTTGTPAGVGVFQNPQVFIKAGDVLEIEAGGIGILRRPTDAG